MSDDQEPTAGRIIAQAFFDRPLTEAEYRSLTDMATGASPINAELKRIAIGLEAGRTDEEYGQLYAAQQALSWVLDPTSAAAPFDVITSGRASRVTSTPAGSGDCSADRRPTLS